MTRKHSELKPVRNSIMNNKSLVINYRDCVILCKSTEEEAKKTLAESGEFAEVENMLVSAIIVFR
jgi:hypothetical protein